MDVRTMQINNKKDYHYYLEADRISLNKSGLKQRLFNRIWKFQRLLRKLEYQRNTNCPKIFQLITLIRYKSLSCQLGFSIPPNVFGPGLSIAHIGTIVVNGNTKVGKNCKYSPGTCGSASDTAK